MRALFVLAAALPSIVAGQSAKWPQFRGPNASGIAESGRAPVRVWTIEPLAVEAISAGGPFLTGGLERSRIPDRVRARREEIGADLRLGRDGRDSVAASRARNRDRRDP